MKFDFDFLIDFKYSIILVCVISLLKFEILEDAIHGFTAAVSGAITSFILYLLKKQYKKYKIQKMRQRKSSE